MKKSKSERLNRRPADKRKTNYKGFLLANVLTLFFALAPASPAGGPVALAAGNIFNFNQKSAYSEPFSKLIEFLNDKKNELEKYDGNSLGAKAFSNANNSVDEINPAVSSFASAVFESVKSFVVDNPKQYFGTVFESVKNFVFPGPNQNNFEYNSPTSESSAREMENLKQQYAEAIDETKTISQKFSLLQNEMEKIKDSGVVVRQPIVEQKVVERTIERIISGSSVAPGLSQGALDSKISEIRTELQNLNINLTNQINNLSARTNSQTAATYQTISLTNKIDSLSGTRLSNITVSGVSGLTDADIPDGITASNYLLLAGGTITGALTGAALSLSGQLTISGTGTSTIAGDVNFDSGVLYLDSINNRIGIGTTSPYAKLSVVGPVAAEYFHATSTTATSTFANLTVNTQLKIGSDYLTDITGTNLSITNGVLNATGGSGVSADWNKQTNYGVLTLTPTTTIPIWAKDAIYASSTLTAQGLATFGNASTSQISATNSYLGTVLSGTWNGTAVANNYGGTGLDSSALTGIAQIVSGTWSASSTLSAAFGGTGWGNLQANTVLLGNGAGRIATTTAGTDGYVLGLSAGVPTWLATSTLSTITGTLTVSKGGTGQTSFGQGWLHSDGTTLTSSTSPTVNYITATSTTATSTFANLTVNTQLKIGSDYLTDITGTNLSITNGVLNATGGSGVSADWNKQTNYGALALTASTTIPYWAKDAIYASSTSVFQGLATFGNASTSQISATNSYLGTVLSGTWNGTAISNQYGGTGLDSSALTGIAQIVSGTWSASSTLSTAFGGTGWNSLQANTVLLGNGAGRLATTTAGTDGYVLGLSAGVPTWLATSTLSTITGTLAVAKGGTGAATLTGLLQGNGTSAITGIAGTAGQFPYYNGTDTLLATSSLFLATSGNVGIGTSTPDSKLTVFNSAADSAIEFSSASGSTYKWTIGLDYSDAGKFKIASSTALGSIDRFTIDGNGYVGIGTSTPARRLDVVDTANPQLRLSQGTTVYTDFSVAPTTGDLTLSLFPGATADDILLTTANNTGANLWVCENSTCPTGITFSGGGNLFVEGNIKYATSTALKTRRSVILTAAGAITPTSGGATKTQVDTATSSYYVLDFSNTATTSAFWQWTMPDSYDSGTIDIIYYWFTTATSGGVDWCFQTNGINTSENINADLSSASCASTATAPGTASTLATTTYAALQTSNFTPGELVTLKALRATDNSGDTAAANARLTHIKIEYGVATESD